MPRGQPRLAGGEFARLGAELVDEMSVEKLARLGLLDRRGTHLSVTPQGRLLLDSILGEIAA